MSQIGRASPIKEITAIELLRKVLLGKKKTTIPHNSVQLRKANQKQIPSHHSPYTPPKPATNANYISDDDDNALPDPDDTSSDSDDDDKTEHSTREPREARASYNSCERMYGKAYTTLPP